MSLAFVDDVEIRIGYGSVIRAGNVVSDDGQDMMVALAIRTRVLGPNTDEDLTTGTMPRERLRSALL